MVSVMTQNIGAGRPGVAYQARQLGLLFNAVAGVLMAVFLFSGAGAILRMVGIADALYEPALIYLKIVGGGCILNAVIPIFQAICAHSDIQSSHYMPRSLEISQIL